MYPKLRKTFIFSNELKLFSDIKDYIKFCLNIYSNNETKDFELIANLYNPITIDECYNNKNSENNIPGIKNNKGTWNIVGHPKRIVKISQKELTLFSTIFNGDKDWQSTVIMMVHNQEFMDILSKYTTRENINSLNNDIYFTQMWNETNSQKDGILKKESQFPETLLNYIFSGPHIYICNPLYKTSRRKCIVNSDYDSIDLMNIDSQYLQRCKYTLGQNIEKILQQIPLLSWGKKYNDSYRIIFRRMINNDSERTLIPAIIPPLSTHTHGCLGMAFRNLHEMLSAMSGFSSLPFDFFIKNLKMDNLNEKTIRALPRIKLNHSLAVRTLLLNSLNIYYSDLWHLLWNEEYINETWSKTNERLNNNIFKFLSNKWTPDSRLITPYTRRQALLEIDVLIAMQLGLSLQELKDLYNIQFYVLKQNENNTWYDKQGRIIYTNNQSLSDVGLNRQKWEAVKDYKEGQTVTQTIQDDTMPNGPIERTITYYAPFDKCNREEDYETAWAFFEEKYKGGK